MSETSSEAEGGAHNPLDPHNLTLSGQPAYEFSPRHNSTEDPTDQLDEFSPTGSPLRPLGNREEESNSNSGKTSGNTYVLYSYLYLYFLYCLLALVGGLSLVAVILFANIHISLVINDTKDNTSKSDQNKAQFILLAVSIVCFILFTIAAFFFARWFLRVIDIYENFCGALHSFFSTIPSLQMEHVPIYVLSKEELSKITEEHVISVLLFSDFKELIRVQAVTSLCNLYLRIYKEMLPYTVIQSNTDEAALAALHDRSSSNFSGTRPSFPSNSELHHTTSRATSRASSRDSGDCSSMAVTEIPDLRNDHVAVSVQTPEKRKGGLEKQLSQSSRVMERQRSEDELGNSATPPSALRRAMSRFKLKPSDTVRLSSASVRFAPSSGGSDKPREASGGALKRRYGTVVMVAFSDFYNIANVVSPELAKEISKAFISYVCKYAKRHHAIIARIQPDRVTMTWNSFKQYENHQSMGVTTALDLVEEVQTQIYNRFPELREAQIPVIHGVGASTFLLTGTISNGHQKHMVFYGPLLRVLEETLKLQLGIGSRLTWLGKPEATLPTNTAAIPIDILSTASLYNNHAMDVNNYIDPTATPATRKEYTLYEICTQVSAVLCLDLVDAFTDFKDGKYEVALRKYIAITKRAEEERERLRERRGSRDQSEDSHAHDMERSFLKMEVENEEQFEVSNQVFAQAYRLRDLCLLYAEAQNGQIQMDDATKEQLRNFHISTHHERLLPHWFVFNRGEVQPDVSGVQHSSFNEEVESVTATPRLPGLKYQYSTHRKSTVQDIIRDIQNVSSTKGSLALNSDASISFTSVGGGKGTPLEKDQTDNGDAEPATEQQPPLNSTNVALQSSEFKDDSMIYRLSEKKLGETPTSEVRLALSYTGSLVAVKVIPLSHDPEPQPTPQVPTAAGARRAGGVQRRRNQRRGLLSATVDVEAITNEIDLLSKLLDPHIVRYISSVVQPNRLLLVMEYVSGGSLHKLLEQYSWMMTVSQARIYLRDVLKGLEYLHKKGIIHRDIKPQNVLIPQTGNCKLSDFGISKDITKDSKGQKFDGTPFYMAPEAASGEACAASDIWSFGIMLAEVLTKKLPWPHSMNPHAMRYQLVKNDQLTPEVQDIDLMPADALYVFQCCTRRNPQQRPSASAILKMPFFTSKNA